MTEVYIISAKRTATGGFLGTLSDKTATELGAIAIKGTYQAADADPNKIDAVYMGNVLSANLGQSPARQASKFALIADHTDCTTVNKVCASGMKATMLGAQQIQLGLENLIITGGMESMSNAPHYAMLRKQTKLGDEVFIDGLLKDGLTDVYHNFHMGNAAELCVKKYNISRQNQDQYALESYAKAALASKKGWFTNEIIPIKIRAKKGDYLLSEDEDIAKVIPEKVPQLKPVFQKEGSITAANASNLNDGASALLLASKEAVKKYNFKPLAKIISFADAAQAPEWFTTAPSVAIKKALKQAPLKLKDIDLWEINEAYAAVVLANQQILDLDLNKINIYGGAVAMGHALGSSGSRIICTLISALKQKDKKLGVAAICNGGGGASAIVIENI